MDFKFDFHIPGSTWSDVESGGKEERSATAFAEGKPRPFQSLCMKDILQEYVQPETAASEVQELILQSKHLPQFWLVRQSLPGDSSDKSIENPNDLVPSVYEGGFKVWECTLDLIEYLDKSYHQALSLQGKKVLDLGCGVGILGFYSLVRGALMVCFQDYNEEVIAQATAPSILYNAKLLNSSSHCDDPDQLPGCSRIPSSVVDKLCFCSGDWSHMKKGLSELEKFETFDVILTAETIYSESCYDRLHNVLDSFLAPDGVILLAAKSHYFGVGGGVGPWCNFVESHGVFEVNTVHEDKDSLLRVIIQMRRK